MNITTRTWLTLALLPAIAVAQGKLAAYPAKVTLDSGLDAHRLVVVQTDAQGITTDVTAAAEITFATPGVAEWRDGELLPVGDGESVARIRHGGLTAEVHVAVRDARVDPPVSFRNDVIPVLTRAGCNGGACHGAAAGKNGFGLTLFGYDPRRDLRAL
ncbi:MAG: cell surface protein, partial [Planctomycetes bacterium]|nr:cell surface protein [Planctomycetota bacterium]